MILKYKCFTTTGISWTIISDINFFRYSEINKTKRQHMSLEVNDMIHCVDKNGIIKESKRKYKFIETRNRTGGYMQYITNMQAYILNDNGKTIEKLN